VRLFSNERHRRRLKLSIFSGSTSSRVISDAPRGLLKDQHRGMLE
jgi:hypothetical protein